VFVIFQDLRPFPKSTDHQDFCRQEWHFLISPNRVAIKHCRGKTAEAVPEPSRDAPQQQEQMKSFSQERMTHIPEESMVFYREGQCAASVAA
jgi:hypothetical protein